ncbi:hypothetical protein BKP35_00805 [Anaerobacillus arseniciselenatis]|uniref:Uncharacterized protein n=1 Tax=Anaerobacillus arseniciselenatis TaxID=85682 RepID=A0A1S2LV87_9BACI|nr:hypothetical protein [Anaerobacillus arseniciselenatis]OIJ15567.1 hypothetical protein BKP35_00805 [Anaerobacillus arseniciselenatis]
MSFIHILSDMKSFLLIFLGLFSCALILNRVNKKVFIIFLLPSILFSTVITLLILLDYQYHFARHTDLSKVSLNGIHVGMKITDSELEKYGEYSTLEGSYYNDLKRYNNFSIDRDDQAIIRYLSTNSEDFVTDQDIRVGDHFKKVKSVYGPNYYYRDEQSMTVLGYRDRKRGISLEFYSIDYFSKEEITAIKMIDYRHY